MPIFIKTSSADGNTMNHFLKAWRKFENYWDAPMQAGVVAFISTWLLGMFLFFQFDICFDNAIACVAKAIGLPILISFVTAFSTWYLTSVLFPMVVITIRYAPSPNDGNDNPAGTDQSAKKDCRSSLIVPDHENHKVIVHYAGKRRVASGTLPLQMRLYFPSKSVHRLYIQVDDSECIRHANLFEETHYIDVTVARHREETS